MCFYLLLGFNGYYKIIHVTEGRWMAKQQKANRVVPLAIGLNLKHWEKQVHFMALLWHYSCGQVSLCLSAFPSQPQIPFFSSPSIYKLGRSAHISTCSQIFTNRACPFHEPNEAEVRKQIVVRNFPLSFVSHDQLVVVHQPFSTDGFHCFSSAVIREHSSPRWFCLEHLIAIATCVFSPNHYHFFSAIWKVF